MDRIRNICIFTILLALVSARGFAFNFGPLFGATIGWTGGSDWETIMDEGDYESDSRGGITYGAVFDFELMRFLSFRPEIQFASPSGRAKGDQKSLRISSRTLHLPLLLAGKFPVRTGSLYALAGPSINLFLREIDTEEEISGDLNKMSATPYYGMVWGLTAGIGYELPVRTLKLLFDLRYHRTVSLILKEWDINFQNFSFVAGCTFPVPAH